MVMIVRRASDRPPRRARARRGRRRVSELADAAGLDERYVREWLGAMTAGRIVELDPETRPVHPARRARCVADAGGLARQPRGRGAVDHEPLERRGRHRRVLPLGRRRAVRALPALPRGDGGGERADGALGALLAHPPARPRNDGAARGGRLAPRSRLWPRPGARCCSPSASRRARSADTTCRRTRSRTRTAQAAERGLENVSFEQRDLSTFDVDAEPEAFAFVTTFDAVHDQARPLALLRGHPPHARSPTASTSCRTSRARVTPREHRPSRTRRSST